MKIAFCDGGLCNRLNSLIFCLILREKYGHAWEVYWPRNNWCGAEFGKLFGIDLPVRDCSILDFKERDRDSLLLLHENPCQFDPQRVVQNQALTGYEMYQALLAAHENVFYMHNLIPPFVALPEVAQALGRLSINPRIHGIAAGFCREHGIDDSVFGLHIRKTDFGDRVNDKELFNLVAAHSGRFFVCSDDEEVNRRFGALPNCSVFQKNHFPQKKVEEAGWVHWVQDSEGRAFPFNIERSEESILEALVDLLILSRTKPVQASNSTFFTMAGIFKAAGFFQP